MPIAASLMAAMLIEILPTDCFPLQYLVPGLYTSFREKLLTDCQVLTGGVVSQTLCGVPFAEGRSLGFALFLGIMEVTHPSPCCLSHVKVVQVVLGCPVLL